MKALTLTAVALLLSSELLVAQIPAAPTSTPPPPPTIEELRNVKTLDVGRMQEQVEAVRGKVVKVKFQCRDPQHVTYGTGLRGQLLSWHEKSRSWWRLNVIIPQEGMAWYLALPTTKENEKFVYARLHGPNGYLLGREIRTGLKGPETVW